MNSRRFTRSPRRRARLDIGRFLPPISFGQLLHGLDLTIHVGQRYPFQPPEHATKPDYHDGPSRNATAQDRATARFPSGWIFKPCGWCLAIEAAGPTACQRCALCARSRGAGGEPPCITAAFAFSNYFEIKKIIASAIRSTATPTPAPIPIDLTTLRSSLFCVSGCNS